jgi:hypothetical protein
MRERITHQHMKDNKNIWTLEKDGCILAEEAGLGRPQKDGLQAGMSQG